LLSEELFECYAPFLWCSSSQDGRHQIGELLLVSRGAIDFSGQTTDELLLPIEELLVELDLVTPLSLLDEALSQRQRGQNHQDNGETAGDRAGLVHLLASDDRLAVYPVHPRDDLGRLFSGGHGGPSNSSEPCR